MFNIFKKKPPVMPLGSLFIKNSDGSEVSDYFTENDLKKVAERISQLRSGHIKNLNIKTKDTINLNNDGNNKFTILYCPEQFLKTAEGEYYQNVTDENNFSQVVKQVVEHFLKTGEREQSIKWETRTA